MASKKQKRRVRNIILVVLLIVLLLVADWLYFQWSSYQKAVHSRFPEFGIIMPAEYSIHGIDVSRYQKYIVWDEVSEMEVLGIKLNFCFIKATEGADRTDQQFSRNWERSKKAGVIRGAYHFFNPNSSAKKQADNFISKVKLESGDLPPVLDIEHFSGGSIERFRQEALRWLQQIEQHYGVRPIIYTNVSFYDRILGSQFDDYALWVAHYEQPTGPRIGRDWSFWQHNEKGHVNGIAQEVDFNVFKGDTVAFKKLLIP